MEPEAFGYCWHRNNGDFYYGIHKGTLDDGYTGSGTKFKRKFSNTDRSEWRRTIEFRGDYDECLEWETDMVTQDMIDQPDCLNLALGGSASPFATPEIHKRATTNRDMSYLVKRNKEIRRYGPDNGMFGRDRSDEDPNKFINKTRATCEHCGMTTMAGLIKRWHNDNCKLKESRDG